MTSFRLLFALVCLTVGVTMVAQPSGIYYGASATLQQADVIYGKAVVNQFKDGSPTVTNATSDEVDDKPLQWDGLVGYRLNFAEGTQFVALQAEISLTGDDISGRLDGEGESPGKNFYGEAWPEDWSIETTRSMGVLLKYGIHRSILETLDISVYTILGVRQTKLDFFSTFRGCFNDQECELQQFRDDSLALNPEVNVAVGGLGIEAGIGSKTALQIEIRAVEDADSTWLSEFSDDSRDVDVPAGFEISSTDVAVKLVRYF